MSQLSWDHSTSSPIPQGGLKQWTPDILSLMGRLDTGLGKLFQFKAALHSPNPNKQQEL